MILNLSCQWIDCVCRGSQEGSSIWDIRLPFDVDGTAIEEVFSRLPDASARSARKAKASSSSGLINPKRAHLLSIAVKAMKVTPEVVKDCLFSLNKSLLTAKDVEVCGDVPSGGCCCRCRPVMPLTWCVAGPTVIAAQALSNAVPTEDELAACRKFKGNLADLLDVRATATVLLHPAPSYSLLSSCPVCVLRRCIWAG